MTNPKRALIFFTLSFQIGIVGAQKLFNYKGYLVYPDSIFLTNAYVLRYNESTIDSLLHDEKYVIPNIYLKYSKAVHLLKKEQTTKANQLLLEASFLAEKNLHPGLLEKAVINLQLGLLRDVYLPEQRLFWLHRTDSIAMLYGHPHIIVAAKIEQVEIYRKMQKFELALELLNELIPYLNDLKDRSKIGIQIMFASVYNQYATDNKDTSFFKKAYLITDSLLKIPSINAYPYFHAMALAEKASSLSNLKGMNEAIPLYIQSRNEFEQLGLKENVLNQDINLFHAYFKQGDYHKVIDISKYLLNNIDETQLAERKHELYGVLSLAYYYLKDYKNAVETQFQFVEEREKLNKIKYNQLIEDLEEKHQTEIKDKQLELVKKENLNKQEENIRKQRELNFLIIVSVIITILLIVALVFMLQFYFARKKILEQAKQLEKNNELLVTVIKQKEFLFKELNHRVKNNLQLISGFIGLQLKEQANLTTEEFVREIQKRISTIALVHEMLYKTKLDEKIDLKQYLQELGDFLLDSLSTQEKNIEFSVEGDTTLLNVDQAVPLGLIINEMITNSVKYAFEEDNLNPEIQIKLQSNNGYLTVVVKDNGIGFKSNMDISKMESLGIKAIRLLSEQLLGKLKYYNEAGAVWELTIPLKS